MRLLREKVVRARQIVVHLQKLRELVNGGESQVDAVGDILYLDPNHAMVTQVSLDALYLAEF